LRKPILAGNWKMNTTLSEAEALAEGIKNETKHINDREVIFCPPFINIPAVLKITSGSNICVGAQNLHFEEKGAFTGEISAAMIKDSGCSHVIIGHSERRQYFGETNESVNKKIFSALKHSLIPIVCIGETLAQREAGQTLEIIETQLKQGLKTLTPEQMQKLVLAYEPVWAIGTGKTATPEQAQEVHAFIRKTLTNLFGKTTAESIRLLYGGSVTPDNASALMSEADIDGALVGGASLKIDSFVKIIKY
jgi:triosephosphate isomerase (TIM)